MSDRCCDTCGSAIRSRESAPGSLRELGIDCYVQLADEKDFPHEGKLDFVESEVNASTGTARLRGVFANKDRALASGLFVRVRVPASKPYQALLIPERALATDQDIKFVYVVGSDGVATRRNVELGNPARRHANRDGRAESRRASHRQGSAARAAGPESGGRARSQPRSRRARTGKRGRRDEAAAVISRTAVRQER